jgi:acetyltransferase-like isoleucine patch superfamily enzyme
MDGNGIVIIRQRIKSIALALATLLVAPELISFRLRARWLGRDRALESSSQLLAVVPGLLGQYLRRAFFVRTLAYCHRSVVIECGTFLTKAGARLEENVYIGPRCQLGLVHIERDALLAAGVHVPSGSQTHGFEDPGVVIREQPGEQKMVRIGSGCWIGSSAIVMADVGRNTVVGAGAVVVRSLPDWVVAVGMPAKVVRDRRWKHKVAIAG